MDFRGLIFIMIYRKEHSFTGYSFILLECGGEPFSGPMIA
jgi:hypothetical protein